MDQQVGAGAILDDIVIVARIGGEHCDAPTVFETIAIAGLDDIAVVDLEGNYFHAARLVDDAVAFELGDVGRNAGERQLLIGDADIDVECVGPLQILDQLACAGWPDYAVGCLARSEV
jgi:hypothetical protein